ncbi:MAG: DUF389 domain-containing protein [Alphaproteobacteria bacterium]|nr:DUF389 domain-containing protein [Alphaproteobacteria bacterium]
MASSKSAKAIGRDEDSPRTAADRTTADKAKQDSNATEDAQLAAWERDEYEFGRLKIGHKRRSLTPERRREILDELFFEKERYWPYVRQFYTLLLISVIIATMGLGIDQPAVVIGGMLIAPLMTPMLAISAALVMGWPVRMLRLVLRGFVATALAFGTAYIIPFLFRVPVEFVIPEQILARANPELPDLIIALAAGTAGAYMLVRKEAVSALPGVAVAVALVPPLCAAGFLAYIEKFGLAWEAFLLYLTNLAAIILSACAVLLLMGFKPKVRQWRANLRVALGLVCAVMLVLAVGIPLGMRTTDNIGHLRDRAISVEVVREWKGDTPVKVISVDVAYDVVELFLQIDVPFASFVEWRPENIDSLFPEEMTTERLRELLIKRLGRPVHLIVRGNFGFREAL